MTPARATGCTVLALGLLLSGCGASTAQPAGNAPAHKVIDTTETGLGTEVTVSVQENEHLKEVFEAVLDQEDAATVTIVCASRPDVEADGYILFGSAAEGVVSRDDRAC